MGHSVLLVVLLAFLAVLLQWVGPRIGRRGEDARPRVVAAAPAGPQVELAAAEALFDSGRYREALALLEVNGPRLGQEPVAAFCGLALRARREAEAAQTLVHRLAGPEKDALPPEGIAAAALFVGEYLHTGRALRAVERDLAWNPDSPHLHAAKAQILVQIASQETEPAARAADLGGTRAAAARVRELTRDPQLRARGDWSLAVHLSLAGRDDEAMPLFDALVADGSLDPGRRAEVAWQAALLALKADRQAEADRYVQLVLDLSRQYASDALDWQVPYPDMALACRYALQGVPIDPAELRHLEERRAELVERGDPWPQVWQRFTEMPRVIASLDQATPQELEAVLVRMERSERAWQKHGAWHLRCPFYQGEGYRLCQVVTRVVRGDALARLGRREEALQQYRAALDLVPGNRSLRQRVDRLAQAVATSAGS